MRQERGSHEWYIVKIVSGANSQSLVSQVTSGLRITPASCFLGGTNTAGHFGQPTMEAGPAADRVCTQEVHAVSSLLHAGVNTKGRGLGT